MSCIAPIDAWQTQDGIKFKPPYRSALSPPIKIPCRNCIGCKIDRSKEWAVRCMHEKSMQDAEGNPSMFITLTYSPEHLPQDEGLHHEHFQAFMKRYRKYIQPKKIKFYMCGEYGEQLGRPHYHAIIFGHQFSDFENIGKNLKTSATLEKLWGKGFVTIGTVTYESSAYVARYIMKKITGDEGKHHYKKGLVNPETGEITEIEIQPEYNRMSTRPAIGKEWFENYNKEIDKNQLHINGRTVNVPKYYLRRLKAVDPARYEILNAERVKAAKENQPTETALEARRLKYKSLKQKRNLK